MTLKEFISTLDQSSQHSLALTLTNRTLSIWDDFAMANKLEYVDTVVGMHHTVARDILSRTLNIIEKELKNPGTQKLQIDELREEFSDPIIAMQDLDWELPYPVERTFYATRNFLDKLNGEDITIFDDPQMYLVINQAIDALETAKIMTEEEIKELLKEYKNGTQHNV